MMATDYIRFLEADFGHKVQDKIKELEENVRRNLPEADEEMNRKEMIRQFQESKEKELEDKKR